MDFVPFRIRRSLAPFFGALAGVFAAGSAAVHALTFTGISFDWTWMVAPSFVAAVTVSLMAALDGADRLRERRSRRKPVETFAQGKAWWRGLGALGVYCGLSQIWRGMPPEPAGAFYLLRAGSAAYLFVFAAAFTVLITHPPLRRGERRLHWHWHPPVTAHLRQCELCGRKGRHYGTWR